MDVSSGDLEFHIPIHTRPATMRYRAAYFVSLADRFDRYDIVYEYILSTKLPTMLVAIGLAAIVSLGVGRPGLWWRGLILNFTPAFAAAFFVIAFFAPKRPDSIDLLGGLLLELSVLCVYFRLVKLLFAAVAQTTGPEASAFLRFSIVLQVLLILPAAAGGEGFGVLSEGTRLDYLYAGPLAKYFTYAGVLLSPIQAAFLAQQISTHGTPGVVGSLTILVNIGLSALSGSKGGAFLWLFSALALVDYRRARIGLPVVLVAGGLLGAALYATSVVVADFIGISLDQFLDLVLSRFFLNNDARALAFDFRTSTTPDAGFLRESFRSIATLMGRPPGNEPLGVELFGELFGKITANGANASLMALIIYYFPAGYAILPAAAFASCSLFLFWLFKLVYYSMRKPGSQVITISFAMVSVAQISQDFLAFQVVMPLVCVALFFVWMNDRRHIRAHRRNRQVPARISPPRTGQRHSPGL